MTDPEKIPHLDIPNPTEKMFQAFVQNSSLENCPRNWGKYFQAAQQWIQEKLGELKITKIIACQYWVTLILKECSEETEARVNAILEDTEQNPFDVSFGRATEETMQYW